jgi:hypothetical protein
MDVVRNPDGTLIVPVEPARVHVDDSADGDAVVTPATPGTRLLHPGEGGYDDALTACEAAMHVVHEVAESPKHEVAPAVEALDDPEAAGEALRHVLIGGQHAVEDFAKETADAEGGDPLKPHEATKIIGEVLAELD